MKQTKSGCLPAPQLILASLLILIQLLVWPVQPLFASTTATVAATVPGAAVASSAPTTAPSTQDPANTLSSGELLQAASGHVSAGIVHSLFIHLDGRLFAMGDNSFGQLGTGIAIDHEEPVAVSLPGEAAAISAGAYHSLVLTTDGQVYAFGRNAFGQLGTGTTENAPTPQQIDALPPAAAIAAGAYHSLILGKDGSVWAFGNNAEGQCGPALSESIQNEKGELVAKRVIRPQRIIASGAVAIAAGAAHSLVLKADGQVLSFGGNSHGQLGDGTKQNHQEPAVIPGIEHATLIAAGSDHSLVVVVDQATAGEQQTLYAFGDNSLGQIGVGSAFTPAAAELSPVKVDWRKPAGKGTYRIKALTAGYGNSLLVITRQDQAVDDPRNTKVLIWGSNAYGQLGNGSSASVAVPRVLTTSDQGHTGDAFLPFDDVAIGGGHILFFSSRGLLGAAGRNDNGQTGRPNDQNPALFTGIPLPHLDEAVQIPGTSDTTTDVSRIKARIFGNLLNDENYLIALQVPWDTTDIFGADSIRPTNDLRLPILMGLSVLILAAVFFAIHLFHKKQKNRAAMRRPGPLPTDLQEEPELADMAVVQSEAEGEITSESHAETVGPAEDATDVHDVHESDSYH